MGELEHFLDALTSARSYREPMPMGEAVRLLEEGAGAHFDPGTPGPTRRSSTTGNQRENPRLGARRSRQLCGMDATYV